jgi:hypothetical protein
VKEDAVDDDGIDEKATVGDEDVDKKAEDILALVAGAPGPYLEDEKSFFGVKRVDSSMKEARMETDIGGMIVTKSTLTYGEADDLAARVDLAGFPAFVDGLTPSSYWTPRPDGWVYFGTLWWAIYSYLATNGYVPGNPASYKNSGEYLYTKVLERLVADGTYVVDTTGRYFHRRFE